VKAKNLILAIIDQGPPKRAFRNFFITGNAWGLFHRNSHIRFDTQKPKVVYNTKETALKSAEAMEKKKGVHFSVYKCAFCDGYHMGRNRENKPAPIV
jgi:hypothetical protein